MAIYASTSTITTQTVPLIVIDPATISDKYILRWNSSVGAFTAQQIEFPDLSSESIIGILPVQRGGTGLDQYNPGDILYANETGTLDVLPIGIGENHQVITSLNGLPVWQDTTNLKNIAISKVSTIGISSTTIGEILPDNCQLKAISIHIDQPYDTNDISISDSDETIITPIEILGDKVGMYIYSLDKLYPTGDQLNININNATTGSMRIFVEYIVL